MGFQEVHDFALAHTLIYDSRVVEGAQLDMPINIEDYRQNILTKIAYQNYIGDFFYSLDPETARHALDAFGQLILSHAPSHEAIQELIDGTTLISDLPALDADVEALIARADQEDQPKRVGRA